MAYRMCGLLAVALAASATDVPASEALWGVAGGLAVSHGDQTLATGVPATLSPTWQMISPATDYDALVEGTARRVTLATDPAVTVTADVAATADGVRAAYTLTPTAPLPVNAVVISWTLPYGVWAGGAWTVDDEAGAIPVERGGASVASGIASEFTLTPPGGPTLTWRFAQPTQVLLQDNREWANDTFTVRLYGLSGTAVSFDQPVEIAYELTASDGLDLVIDGPVTLAAGDEWVPITLIQDTLAGSALDFSQMGLQDGPAGEHGWLRAVGDHFEFTDRPGQPVTFYGVNLVGTANYPEHELAERLAARFAAAGYNTVRFHHHERPLVEPNQPNSLGLRADVLDRFDYFVDALARHGVYVTLDLFVSRQVMADETVPGGQTMDGYKQAVIVSDRARDNLKEWTRRTLTHVNPYRGLSLAQDPVMTTLVLVNEGTSSRFIGRIEGEVRDLYEARWNEWLLARYGDAAGLAAAWDDAASGDPAAGTVPLPGWTTGQRMYDLHVFFAQLHTEFYEDMASFIRDELGCPVLLSDCNDGGEVWPLQQLRTNFDFVDNHAYWDHPVFLRNSWQLPSRGGSGGLSSVAERSPLHRRRAVSQLLDRPYTFSEFNYSVPNQFRVEGGPLTGAYGALQGWDGIWRFAYSHSREALDQTRVSSYFDLASDPAAQAADRFAVLLFRRDAAPARHTVALRATPEAVLGTDGPAAPLDTVGRVSLLSRLGTRIGAAADGELTIDVLEADDPLAATDESAVIAAMAGRGWLDGNATDAGAGVYVSDTDQLRLDSGAGLFTVDTPGTACVFSARGTAADAGAVLSIGATDGPIGVFVASLDDTPLAAAPRLLLAHLPDVQATGRVFGERARQTVLDWGQPPLLVRALTTEVRLALDEPAAYTVYPLALDGSRGTALVSRVEDGRLVFEATSRGAAGGQFYYEIVR